MLMNSSKFLRRRKSFVNLHLDRLRDVKVLSYSFGHAYIPIFKYSAYMKFISTIGSLRLPSIRTFPASILAYTDKSADKGRQCEQTYKVTHQNCIAIINQSAKPSPKRAIT